jgi:transposase-like protein
VDRGALKFIKKALKRHGRTEAIVTDGLRSYGGPNLFHQSRTVSWQMSMPRSNSRSSTLRRDSG